MRLTFFDFRQAVADPTYGVQARPGFPTASSVLRAAVRTYHVEGYESAQRRLDQGFSNYFSRPGSPAGMARVARANFDAYVKLDGQDGRPAFDFAVRTVLDFGSDELAVILDVLLLDDNGYVGRMILWGDMPPMSRSQLELLATPVILAMRQTLGRDRVVGVEVWEIRTERITVIPNDKADAREALLGEVVQRLSLSEVKSRPEDGTPTLW